MFFREKSSGVDFRELLSEDEVLVDESNAFIESNWITFNSRAGAASSQSIISSFKYLSNSPSIEGLAVGEFGLSVVFVRSGSLAVSGSSAVFSGIADVEILEGLVAVISKVSEAIIESKRKSEGSQLSSKVSRAGGDWVVVVDWVNVVSIERGGSS